MCCPDSEQKAARTFFIELLLFLFAVSMSIRSSVKKRCDSHGLCWDSLTGSQYFILISFSIFLDNSSIQRMNI